VYVCLGIRLGTPALTSRGFKEEDFEKVADFLHEGMLSFYVVFVHSYCFCRNSIDTEISEGVAGSEDIEGVQGFLANK
jgi:glycine/serine hydroxymethyltransferase